MRSAIFSLVLATVAGISSSSSAAGINPTQGDMSDGASAWLAYGPTAASVSPLAQSPFTNVFADNNAGLVLPVKANAFEGAVFRGLTPQTGTALINMDVQILGSSAEGYYFFIGGTNGSVNVAVGTAFAGNGPLSVWDAATGPIHPDNAATAANKWYNITLALDFSADTMVSYVTPFGGTTVITPFALDIDMTDVNFINIASSGAANDVVYFDNFAVSAIPEPTSMALLGLVGLGLIRRRRRAC